MAKEKKEQPRPAPENEQGVPVGERLVSVLTPEEAREKMNRISRRGFIWAGVSIAAAIGGWEWLVRQPEEDGIGRPLRRVLGFNERVARAYQSDSRLSPTFPDSYATEPVTTGDVGLGGSDDDSDGDSGSSDPAPVDDKKGSGKPKPTNSPPTDDSDSSDDSGSSTTDDDTADWQLNVIGGRKPGLALTLAQIQALPKVDVVAEHKCIEGWSRVVHWTGARFSDFAKAYGPAHLPDYVSVKTPDEAYYVGVEREAMLHPQVLLCYAMNGQPLTDDHGAPLRLVMPNKYGVKSLKLIGSIEFTSHKPADYWAEQGYDWYAGL